MGNIFWKLYLTAAMVCICGVFIWIPQTVTAEMAVLSDTAMGSVTGAEGVCFTAVKGDCPNDPLNGQPAISGEEVINLIRDGAFDLTLNAETLFVPPVSTVMAAPQMIDMNASAFEVPVMEAIEVETSISLPDVMPSLETPEATYIHPLPVQTPSQPQITQPQVDAGSSWGGMNVFSQ